MNAHDNNALKRSLINNNFMNNRPANLLKRGANNGMNATNGNLPAS